MEILKNALQNFNYGNLLADIPLVKIVIVIVILAITQFSRQFISRIIFGFLERLASKSETDADDELIEILKPALNYMVLLFGLWLVETVFAEELGPGLTANIESLINFIIVVIIGYVVFRAASLLGRILANSVLRTETELDELFKPFLPKIFQAIAVMVIIIKASEIFLGASAGALVGLLGGAGITIGLLFKDIVYDWFCTVIIYTDGLFKEGDWVSVSGVDGFTQVLNVGFRSTTLKIINWGSVQKMPNSQMITGIVQNWSQTSGDNPLAWGHNFTLKIDGISAAKTSKVCQSIRDAIADMPGMSPNYVVRFSGFEGNARVIQIKMFVEDLDLYFASEERFNIAVLEILEKEGINSLQVYLRTEPENYQKTLAAANN